MQSALQLIEQLCPAAGVKASQLALSGCRRDKRGAEKRTSKARACVLEKPQQACNNSSAQGREQSNPIDWHAATQSCQRRWKPSRSSGPGGLSRVTRMAGIQPGGLAPTWPLWASISPHYGCLFHLANDQEGQPRGLTGRWRAHRPKRRCCSVQVVAVRRDDVPCAAEEQLSNPGNGPGPLSCYRSS